MRTMETLTAPAAVSAPSLNERGVDSGVAAPSALAARLADYLELTKPRIAVLVLVTVTVGYLLGCRGPIALPSLLHALVGIAMVAGASSALNQFIERHTDARMTRTAHRPLPAGRMRPAEVLMFGLALGAAGCLYLAATVNGPTAALSALTLGLYAGVYTPLKRRTSLSTTIGAVPGALPPVLGWAAATGRVDAGALALFAILFLWQFPHFLAICWLYRDQYARAGLRMLPAARPRPRVTGGMAVAHALALLPVSLLPSHLGLAGDGYFLAAVVLGLGYLACSIRFLCDESTVTARRLLWSSLVYLPLLLLSLTWDHFRLLQ